MDLLNIYNQNNGVNKLFSKTDDVEWYDGIVTGICKLNNSETWFICNLCFYKPTIPEMRIYTLIEVSNIWIEGFNLLHQISKPGDRFSAKMKMIKDVYDTYTGPVFLMKTPDLNSLHYELADIPLKSVHFFEDVEYVFDQDEKAQAKWLSFFK